MTCTIEAVYRHTSERERALGVFELIIVVAAVLSAVAATFVIRRVAPSRVVEPRRPLPLAATIVSAGLLLLGPVFGFVLGGMFFEGALLDGLGESSTVQLSPGDRAATSAIGAALVAFWLALPGGSALLWLLLSTSRSLAVAGFLAASSGLGFALGMALGFELSGAVIEQSGLLDTSIELVELARMSAFGTAGLGLAGANGLCLLVLSASSRRSLIAVLRATPFIFAGAVILSALVTPPDFFSFLLMLSATVVCWLAGLGFGAIWLRVVRSRR